MIGTSQLINAFGAPVCFTDTTDIFKDGSGVALYSLDYDASDAGGLYDGTPTNVDFGVNGQINYGARFNGSSSRIVTGVTPATGSGQFSVSGWVNVDSLSVISGVFSTITNSVTDRKGFSVHILTSGIVRVLVYDSAGSDVIESTDLITVGNWHHIAITYNNGLTKLYVDGNVQTDTVNQLITGYHDSINIGRYFASVTSNTMLGKIDQVRIFSKALNQTEVDTLFAEDACVHTSTTDIVNYPTGTTPVAYYKLDNNSKDSARSTGKFNEGAIFNGSSSKIELPNTSLGITDASNFSISYWFNTNSTTQDNQSVIWANASNAGARFGTGINSTSQGGDTSVYFGMPINGTFTYINSGTSAFTANTWVHVVCVKSSTAGMSLYVDNVLKATNTGATGSGSATATGKNSIGMYHTASDTYFFNGSIDQVRIYNTALSSTDVSNLYAETAGDTSTLSFPSGQTAIATYQLDGNSTDLSGNYNGTDTNITYAYDGTDTNVEYRFGRFGQAAVFNGSSSYISGLPTITNSGALSNSISLWFRRNGNPSALEALFGETSDDSVGGSDSVFTLYINTDGTLELIYRQTSPTSQSTITIRTTSTYTDDNWYNVVCTLDSSEIKLFVNGEEDASSPTTIIGTATLPDQYIGAVNNRGTAVDFFNGSIDQVRIYDAALTSDQVTELYNEKPEVDTSNFKTVLYNGNGSTQYISNVGFQPDLVWIKSRNASASHVLSDSVRGANLKLRSNSTAAEAGTDYGVVTSFDSNGFSVGGTIDTGDTNYFNRTYVAWVWKGGGDAVAGTGTGVTNVSVSANTEAGFSIVKFTGGSGSGQTVEHGLDEEPEIYFLKGLDNGTDSWIVCGNSTIFSSPTTNYLRLNTTASVGTTTANSVGSNGNDINVGVRNYNGQDTIAYCWHSVAGYSKIGSYEGLGTSTVTVSDVGFKPSFIMIKNIDATANWNMYDLRRSTVTDRANGLLYPNLNNAEVSNSSTYYFDMNDSGFVVSASNHEQHNFAGRTYIYMAFK